MPKQKKKEFLFFFSQSLNEGGIFDFEFIFFLFFSNVFFGAFLAIKIRVCVFLIKKNRFYTVCFTIISFIIAKIGAFMQKKSFFQEITVF